MVRILVENERPIQEYASIWKNNPTIKLKEWLELIVLPLFSKTDLVKQNSKDLTLKEGYLGIYLQPPTLPESKQCEGCYTDNSNKVYQHSYFNMCLVKYVAIRKHWKC